MALLSRILQAANRPGTALLRTGQALTGLPGVPRDVQRFLGSPAVSAHAATLDRIPEAIRGPASTSTLGRAALAGGQSFAARTGDPLLQRAWAQPHLQPVAAALNTAGRALADTYHATTLSGIRASSNLGPQWAHFRDLPVLRTAGTAGTATALGGMAGGAANQAFRTYWDAPRAATEAAGLTAPHAEPFRQAVAEQTNSGQMLGKLLVPDALANRTPGEAADRALALKAVGEGVRKSLADPTPGPLEGFAHATEYATPYHYLLGKVFNRVKGAVRETAAATPPAQFTPDVVKNVVTGQAGPLQEGALMGRYRQAQDQLRPYWEAAKKWKADHGL